MRYRSHQQGAHKSKRGDVAAPTQTDQGGGAGWRTLRSIYGRGIDPPSAERPGRGPHGKESHDLKEVQGGLTPAISAYVHYFDEEGGWERDKQSLRIVPRKFLARWSGLHVRSIKAILNTSRLPHSAPKEIPENAEQLRRRYPELLKFTLAKEFRSVRSEIYIASSKRVT